MMTAYFGCRRLTLIFLVAVAMLPGIAIAEPPNSDTDEAWPLDPNKGAMWRR